MITKEQLAAKLNGREYGEEISPAECEVADDADLVVVFGYSDDNMEFRGAIHDEVGCYDGGDAFVTRDGLLENRCDHDDCPYYKAERANHAKIIRAVWCKDGQDFTWVYETTIPHAVFEIHDGDEPFCQGIVFDLRNVI